MKMISVRSFRGLMRSCLDCSDLWENADDHDVHDPADLIYRKKELSFI